VNLRRPHRARSAALLAVTSMLVVLPGRAPVAASAPGAPAPPAAVTAAAAEIAAARLHADVAFLADDMLEGRATATCGYDLAAAYVAARMAALGLEPAGDSAYHQRVPLRRAVLDQARSSLALVRGEAEQPLVLDRDALLSPDFLRGVWSTDAPLVFGLASPPPSWGTTTSRTSTCRARSSSSSAALRRAFPTTSAPTGRTGR